MNFLFFRGVTHCLLKANMYVLGPWTRSLTRNNEVLGLYAMIQATFVWLYSSVSIYPTPWNSQSCNFLCCFRPYNVWVCESNPTVGSILSQVTPVYILMQNMCKICCSILPSAVLFLLWSPPFCVQLWSLISIWFVVMWSYASVAVMTSCRW